jgi:hypothetical protein
MKKLYFLIFAFLIISNLYSVFHKVGGIQTTANVVDMEIINNIAFISDYNDNLMAYDISSLNNPGLIFR